MHARIDGRDILAAALLHRPRRRGLRCRRFLLQLHGTVLQFLGVSEQASRYRHSIDGENPAAYRPFRLSDDESIGWLECTLSGLRLLVIAADDADVAIGFHVSRLDIAAVLQPLCAEFGH